MTEYPNHHREIVDTFLNGRFILHSEKLYSEVKEHERFYKIFFKNIITNLFLGRRKTQDGHRKLRKRKWTTHN